MSDSYYPHHLDCLWLAHDRNNHIGGFVTAGLGPIPVDLLDLDASKVRESGRLSSDLPKVSGSRLLVSMYKDPSSFLDLAERGIFVYDWTDIHGGRLYTDAYELVATPTTPLLLASLPDRLRALTSLVKFDANDFSEEKYLKVHDYCPCRKGRY
jgi:hypothetical protein